MSSLPAPPEGTPSIARPRFRAGRATLILAGCLVVLYLLLPAFNGFHLGFNSATDNTCMTRVVQWCKFVPGNGPP